MSLAGCEDIYAKHGSVQNRREKNVSTLMTGIPTSSRNGLGTLGKPVSELSLVEIAERLERVTAEIESERAVEREARKQYEAVASKVESRIAQIRERAQELMNAQRRKVSSFDGILRNTEPEETTDTLSMSRHKNISEAILAIWEIERGTLTSEEIADGLSNVGYVTNAAPTSLRSSVNQAIAKLCRAGHLIRFRSDGSTIPPRDTHSRARKYLLKERYDEVVAMGQTIEV